MNRKIPQDAFGYYFSLGQDRSYQAVAEKYGVSKKAVAKLAKREDWSRRITEIEEKAAKKTDEKLAETLEQMTERHVKMFKLIQRKALEALKSMPINTAYEAIKALDLTTKNERLARGEPTDRSALNIEDVIRKEYEQWMVSEDEEQASE